MRKKLEKYYTDSEKKYGGEDGLTTGEIAPMFGKKGGGMQHDMPFNMKELKRLKMIKKVKI